MRRTTSSLVLGGLLLLVMPAARSDAWVRGGGGHWHGWGGPRVVVAPFFGWGFYAPPLYTAVAPPALWVPVPATPQ